MLRKVLCGRNEGDGVDAHAGSQCGSEGCRHELVAYEVRECVVVHSVNGCHHLFLQETEVDDHAALFTVRDKGAGTCGNNTVAMPMRMLALTAMEMDAVPHVDADFTGNGMHNGAECSITYMITQKESAPQVNLRGDVHREGSYPTLAR